MVQCICRVVRVLQAGIKMFFHLFIHSYINVVTYLLECLETATRKI